MVVHKNIGEKNVRKKEQRQEKQLNFLCNGLYEISICEDDWITKVENKVKEIDFLRRRCEDRFCNYV